MYPCSSCLFVCCTPLLAKLRSAVTSKYFPATRIGIINGRFGRFSSAQLNLLCSSKVYCLSPSVRSLTIRGGDVRGCLHCPSLQTCNALRTSPLRKQCFIPAPGRVNSSWVSIPSRKTRLSWSESTLPCSPSLFLCVASILADKAVQKACTVISRKASDSHKY